MPLSSNGLCDAEITRPATKPWLPRQVRDGRRRDDARAHARWRRPPRRPDGEIALDPLARLARVAADQQARRAAAVRAAPCTSATPSRRIGPRDREEACRPGRGRRRCRTVSCSSDGDLDLRGIDARPRRTSCDGRDAHGQACSGRRRGRSGRRTPRWRPTSELLQRVVGAAHGDRDVRRRRLRRCRPARRFCMRTGTAPNVRSVRTGAMSTVTRRCLRDAQSGRTVRHPDRRPSRGPARSRRSASPARSSPAAGRAARSRARSPRPRPARP